MWVIAGPIQPFTTGAQAQKLRNDARSRNLLPRLLYGEDVRCCDSAIQCDVRDCGHLRMNLLTI